MSKTERAADAVIIAVAALFLAGVVRMPLAFPISRRQVIAASAEMDKQRKEVNTNEPNQNVLDNQENPR